MLKGKHKDAIKINVSHGDEGKEKKIRSNESTLMKDIAKNNIPPIKSKSQDISAQVSKSDRKRKQFMEEIKYNMSENKKVLKKSSSSAIARMQIEKEPPRVSIKKERSLIQLSQSLNKRISMEKQAGAKLSQLSQEETERKKKLERKILELKNRNVLRMKELKDYESKYIQKLNYEYMKDKQKEEKLVEEYAQIMFEHGKIKQTQSYRKSIEKDDWQEIVKQKNKLEEMIKQFQKKQQILVKEQNPEILEKVRREQKKKIAEKDQPQQLSAEEKLKGGDAKKMGNEYLQFAKKLRDVPKEKKIKLLDVKLKCIDYDGDMISKIARNTQDLSKIKVDPLPVTVTAPAKQITNNNSSFKMPVFELKEDDETKKYLDEIKQNLKSLEKGKIDQKKSEQPIIN